MKRRLIFLVFAIYLMFAFIQCERQPTSIPSESLIISVSGGGFYGGINPPTISKTLVYSNGKIVVTNGTLYGDTTDSNFVVSLNEIKELEDIINENGFFYMSNLYDCSKMDTNCQNRKTSYPSPIPLLIEANFNNKSKTVEISMIDRDFLEYPTEIDTILLEIGKLVYRAKSEIQ
jgi:hypothetical protein